MTIHTPPSRSLSAPTASGDLHSSLGELHHPACPSPDTGARKSGINLFDAFAEQAAYADERQIVWGVILIGSLTFWLGVIALVWL